MDFAARLEQFRDELLHNRKYALAAGVLVLVLSAITLAGGYMLFRKAVDDNRPTSAKVTNVPSQVNLLLAEKNRTEVVNHIVFFNDVHLEAGPTDNVYYAVGAAGGRILVISQGAKSAPESGEVDIKGTIRPVPPATTMKTKWKLTKDEIAELKQHGIYIEADEIVARRATPKRVARK